jgi:hypothetical protein
MSSLPNDANKQSSVQDVPAVDPDITGDSDITGAAKIKQWKRLSEELGEDAVGVHDALGFSAIMLVEFATECESGEWAFATDGEIQASRLFVDAMGKALALVERRLRQDEAEAALLSLTAEEIGALIGVARMHHNMMRIADPNAEEKAEYQLLQGAVHKLESGQLVA